MNDNFSNLMQFFKELLKINLLLEKKQKIVLRIFASVSSGESGIKEIIQILS